MWGIQCTRNKERAELIVIRIVPSSHCECFFFSVVKMKDLCRLRFQNKEFHSELSLVIKNEELRLQLNFGLENFE